MEFSHILMFIAGGLISAFLFKPKKEKLSKDEQIKFLAMTQAFQFYAGVHQGQTNKELPPVETEDDVQVLTSLCSKHFTTSAEKSYQIIKGEV